MILINNGITFCILFAIVMSETCEELTDGISYGVTCSYKNVVISCNETIRPETQAEFRCKTGYMKPETSIPDDTAVCLYSGNWDHQAYACLPVCGIVPPTLQPYIHGEPINNIYAPWNVVIYTQNQNKENDSEYKNICGGTIVTARIVISAAHCFWNTEKNEIYDKRNFLVVAGKYYRKLEVKDPQRIQRFNIKELVISNTYRDRSGNYEADMAILVLGSHIIYEFHIKPACIDTNLIETEQILEPGTIGSTVGFGVIDNENNLTDVLRVAQQEVKIASECNIKSGSVYTYITTGDKICVQGTDTDAVCQGDSGGGFVVPKIVNNQSVNFLWGVVSHSAAGTRLCSGNSYVAFTNVQKYIGKIKEYFLRYRTI